VEPDVVVESRKAPEPDTGDVIMPAGGESSLLGHLTPAFGEVISDDAPDIDDYQLRMAFQIVRGLSAAKDKKAR
jgi:hypothetical protein